MLLKTDPMQGAQDRRTNEFGLGFLILLVLATFVALLVTLWSNDQTRPHSTYAFEANDYRSMTIAPWILAGSKTIENVLSAFRGKDAEYILPSFRAMVILSLIIVFVVCPTVYLFRWREHRLKTRRLRDEPLHASDLVYGFCALITLFVAVGIIPLTIRQEIIRYSVRHAQAVQRNKDHLINSIEEVVFNMEQYWILPKSEAGGEGNLNGYSLPQELSRTEDGTLTTTAAGDSGTIVARSSLYPSSSISVAFKQIDLSQPYIGMRIWKYEDEFM
jgi:membrane protein YdbS with pleckstrin-like domain